MNLSGKNKFPGAQVVTVLQRITDFLLPAISQIWALGREA